jgi:carbon starvation protein
VLQELTGAKGLLAAAVATALTAGAPLAVLLSAGEGAYATFWVLFGTSNQLLAALTLLAVTVWLRRSRRPSWFTAVPMVFVMGITLWSLVGQGIGFFRRLEDAKTGVFSPSMLANGVVSVLLVGLTALLVVESFRALRNPLPEEAS